MPVRMEAIDLGSLISQSLGEMNERLAARKLEILVSNHCAQSTPVMNTAWNPKASRPAGEECAEGNVNVAPFDAAPFDAADGMTEGMRAGVQAAAAGSMDGAAVFDDGAAAGIASAGPRVMADGQLLWRVLENLLGNVSKYALPGSRVYLDISSVNRKAGSAAGTTASAGCSTSAGTASAGAAANGFVLLEVKNISRDRLNISADELMERFKRGDESRNTEGSGLGLAIARDLTKLMDGVFEITVDGDLFKASVLLKQA